MGCVGWETLGGDKRSAQTADPQQLLGFYLIDFPDLDAAIETARELAEANPGPGCYEIRPVGYFTEGALKLEEAGQKSDA